MEHNFRNIPGYATLEMQGELIKHLINELDTTKKLKIAEIGVYMGRGTSIWNVELLNANVEFEYYAIDHFEGSPEHHRSNELPNYEKALEYLQPFLNNVKVICADSIESSKTFEDEYFDIVYIDAAHEYESVHQDITAWLPKVKTGGYLCGDDYHPVWPGVIQAADTLLGNVKVIGGTQWLIQK